MVADAINVSQGTGMKGTSGQLKRKDCGPEYLQATPASPLMPVSSACSASAATACGLIGMENT